VQTSVLSLIDLAGSEKVTSAALVGRFAYVCMPTKDGQIEVGRAVASVGLVGCLVGDVSDVPQPPLEIHVSLKGTNRQVPRAQMVRMRMWARVQVWEQSSRHGDKTSNTGPDTDTTPTAQP
jgi:hypothetical protein